MRLVSFSKQKFSTLIELNCVTETFDLERKLIESSSGEREGETAKGDTNFLHVCNYVTTDQLTTSKGNTLGYFFHRENTFKNLNFHRDDHKERGADWFHCRAVTITNDTSAFCQTLKSISHPL